MMFKKKDRRRPSATRTMVQVRTTNTKTNNIQRIIQRNERLTLGPGITINHNDYLLKQAAEQYPSHLANKRVLTSTNDRLFFQHSEWIQPFCQH